MNITTTSTQQKSSRRENNSYSTSTHNTTPSTTKDTAITDDLIIDDDDESCDLAFDQTILDDTNKILKELERKLSISSSTSSQQTNTSSVVHNNQYQGLGKQRIQSHVINSMLHDSTNNNNSNNNNGNVDYDDHEKTQRIHNSIFNPNEIFQQRSQYTKYTKLSSHYNDDSIVKKKNSNGQLIKQRDKKNGTLSTVVRQNSLNLTKNRLESKGSLSSSYNNNDIDDNGLFSSEIQKHDIYASDEEEEEQAQEEEEEDEDEDDGYDVYFKAGNQSDNDVVVDDDDYMDTFDDGSTAYSDDDDDHIHGEDKQMDLFEYEYEEDLIIPPSPPRSPPRDLDPTKLYGLYDFSGPDPSHCSLTRDEPVHLLNDEDNYWWLIRKLTKDEKIARYQATNDESIDIESDKEDGKIGFVPAECLETHGERLARLNCHKNEEMEKLLENGLTLIDREAKANKNVKAVTFENLGDLIDSDEEEEEEEEEEKQEVHLTQNGKIDNLSTGGFVVSKDEHDIRKILELYNVDLNELHPPTTSSSSHHQEHENLSDVYPIEAPLIINKRK
ncbi:BUD14 [Candida metapsilosis]|uniref:BUD14 n=1 Tax=Candida metapsilosis TaxID=273372 RepID=A0A8H7Z9C4_9ASCO|nr:BUD14 [Candida metapsilosis]